MTVTINGSAGVTTNSGAVYNGLQTSTAVTASGTSVDFTGIPSWVKRITVMFQGVSTNGSSVPIVQIGSGSVQTSGYSGSVGNVVAASAVGGLWAGTGAPLRATWASTNVFSGAMSIVAAGSNIYVISFTGGLTDTTAAIYGGGSVTLSGTLDRIRITATNGTDQFDAGTINILYE
jgi:hypothetical protein